MAILFRKLRGLTWRHATILAVAGILVCWTWLGSRAEAATAMLPVVLMQLLVVVLILMTTRRLSFRIVDAGASVRRCLDERISRSRECTASSDGARVAGVRWRAGEPVTARLGARRFYAKMNSKKLDDLVQQLVLDRSIEGRDILAHAFSRGALDFDGILVLLEAFRSPSKRAAVREAVSKYDRRALLALARVLYRQDALASDRLNAISLFQLARRCFGRRALEAQDSEWLVLALSRERRFEEAERCVEALEVAAAGTPNHGLVQANLTNPAIRPGVDPEAWVRWLGIPYHDAGLEPPILQPGSGSAFQRLHCIPATWVDAGPLVSVVMPVHCAGEAADVAIRSVLAQSWRRLELIIVDDGSPTRHLALLERWVAADPRVRLIRCAKNRGAYTARNIGLAAAQGEFVTCHDADDWSHPRKLQVQVEDLLAHPDRIANMTRLIRVSEDLEIHHRHPGRALAHPALASLMFRRRPVAARLGCWDPVRKMGDAEFLRRIELVFAQTVPVVGGEAPLCFALQAAGSLSGSDMLRGYMAPERQVYRSRYREWHALIAEGLANPKLDPEGGVRPFPAPASFLPVLQEEPPFDVIYVSELGFSGGNAHSLVHEMSIAVAAGLRVGLVRVRNVLFTHLATREPIPALTELVASGAVTEIALTTPAYARLLVVRWPACFQYAPGTASAIRAGRTVIVANHPPYERHQDRHSYEMEAVSRNVRAAFGAEPEWSPQSATIRAMLDPQLPHGSLLDIDWVAVLAEEPQRVRSRSAPLGALPVIGRHSRDHFLKWPESRAKLLKVYPTDGSVKVRILGGVEHVAASGALLPEDAAGWEVHAFNAIAPMEFLQGIDFFVYYHHKDWVEAFGRVIMEAMFAGAVVVLPPQFQAVFGDAAVYAEPDGVQALIHRYHVDRALFQAQSERGLSYVLSNCTPSAYVRRLARLGVQATDDVVQVGVA